MDRFLAIVNPVAGRGRCGQRAPDVLAQLMNSGVAIDIKHTHGAGEATELARTAYAQGRRKFIAVGGDGTSYEIINGLFPAAADNDGDGDGGRVTLGFLPLGTGNSFLRDFTNDGESYAIRALIDGKRRPCDVVRLRHADGVLHYINILSLGFVADVCSVTNRRFKGMGEAGYGFGVITTLLGLHHEAFPMRVDDSVEYRDPTAFISICNSKFTGGKMMMAPRADTADGEADLIIVGPAGRLSLLRTFPKIFAGTHVDHPDVQQSRLRKVSFDIDHPVDVMIDGEVFNLVPQELDVLAGALEVVA